MNIILESTQRRGTIFVQWSREMLVAHSNHAVETLRLLATTRVSVIMALTSAE